MNKLLYILFLSLSMTCFGQLFDNPKHTELVRKTVGYVYNMQPDSANLFIDSVDLQMPFHPVVPLMRAMNVLWTSMPNVTEDSSFSLFTAHLYEAVRLAQKIDGGRQEDPEAIFFEVAARGLLAEYYADGDFYMKALTEAGQAYNLLRSVNQLTEVNPEFYLPAGVYNYFREKYPERHPSFKPLLWFFRSGDADLGIVQLKEACKHAVLTKVEAYVYLSYVYLRYEEIPELAQGYLLELHNLYPQNYYVTAKYLEALEAGNVFGNAPLEMISQLMKVDKPYYRLAGNMFMGLYKEVVNEDFEGAMIYYKKSIIMEKRTTREPDYYLCLAHLGLARIYAQKGNKEKAILHAKESLSYAETNEMELNAKAILYKLE